MLKTIRTVLRAIVPPARQAPARKAQAITEVPFGLPDAEPDVERHRVPAFLRETEPAMPDVEDMISGTRAYGPSSVPRYPPGPQGVADAIDDAVLQQSRRRTDEDRHQRDVVNHAPFAYVDMGSSCDSGGASGSCGGCGGGD